MISKDKATQGIAHPLIIVAICIITIVLILVLLPSKQETQEKPQTTSTVTGTQPSSAPDVISKEQINIGTYAEVPSGIDVKEEWETYVNPIYNYEISNPNGEWVLYINDFTNSDINLRLKADDTPARHGFSIAVIENPKYPTMKGLCDNNEISENTGILCNKDISTTTTQIGTTSWEKIAGSSIGVVPSFNVILSTFYDNKIYYVVSEGYSIEQISEVLESFRFTK